MEVCLAVLVVGLGLMSIFAMFPTGLAASESAAADTDTSLFAEQVLWGLQAAAAPADGSSWRAKWDANTFVIPDGAATIAINGPLQKNAANTVQYTLTLTPRGTNVKEVRLNAASLKASPVTTTVFYTELYYMELP